MGATVPRRRRRRRWRLLACGLVGAAVMAGCSSGPSSAPVVQSVPVAPGAWDWPTYGHDAQHTFHGRTTLTESTAKRLKVAWFFPTADVVTATPTVVDGTVYAGSWDDTFYALDLRTGALRWTYRLSPQDAVTPYPGQQPRDATSDGGLVTASAWYQSGSGTRPDLVIFAGGYTLYALDAATGALYWRHDYTGRPGRPPDPDKDGTRIFSSPVVVGDKVLFGVDVDGQNGERGYVAAADLDTGKPVWELQTDVDQAGRVLDDGCGSVWSSGTVLPATRAGRVRHRRLRLLQRRTPVRWPSSPCTSTPASWPGSTARPCPPPPATGTSGPRPMPVSHAQGTATFLGVGGKDGTYYSLDPATGHLVWATNVVFGGFSGGFIATTAYDGQRVYGSTALGDFGHFEKDSQILCDPSDPRDTATQEPSVDAFDAATGAIAWQTDTAASFAPTTVAGGMTFNGPAIVGDILLVRDAATGALVTTVKVPGPIWSGVATVGDALVTGIGSSYTAHPAGIAAITPGGAPPVVPH